MLKARLLMGSAMAALAAGLLIADGYLAPWFPFLYVTVALLALAAGRDRMTPTLSPKKTWEGAAGGLLFAVLAAIGIAALGSPPPLFAIKATVFGLIVGVAGMLGDLAESLLKREGRTKDASATVPGF